MNAPEALNVIKDVVAEVAGVNKSTLSEKTDFHDLGIDSIDRVEMVMGFEEKFNMTISDEQSEELRTIGDVLTYVVKANPT